VDTPQLRRCRGWILNLSRDDQTREEERYQRALFDLDGEPVFEVWLWYSDLERWFVLSWERDPKLEAQGVIYYNPNEIPDGLRSRVRGMRKMRKGFRVAG
jgi:hypothetical protein